MEVRHRCQLLRQPYLGQQPPPPCSEAQRDAASSTSVHTAEGVFPVIVPTTAAATELVAAHSMNVVTALYVSAKVTCGSWDIGVGAVSQEGVLAHTFRCPEKRSQELIRVHREVGSTSGLRFSHWHLPRTLHECAPLRTACSTGPQCSVRSVMYLSILFGLVCPTTKVCPFVSLENQTTG